MLDDRSVEAITAFLFHGGGSDDPTSLRANDSTCFIGSYVLGLGFTFDDQSNDRDAVSSLAEREALIAKDARNAERIFPYLGGEELNDDPEQRHHRYVINFGEMTEDEAREWPDLMAIVEAKVKPDRLGQNREVRARYWWRFGETTPALNEALKGRRRVLAVARVSRTCAFAFLPAGLVYSEKMIVFPEERDGFFAVMQSRVHEVWARFFSSTMKDDLQYTPSDCFETFPFPARWEESAALAEIGARYHAFRAELMKRRGEGLTKTYNRFHAPDEYDDETLELRKLHDAMDRAVLDAYGWSDLRPECEFLLDWEEPEEDDGAKARKKKPWRYRWPDAVRDDVLARLLALNAERAKEEAKAALLSGGGAKKAKGRGAKGGSGTLL